MVEALFLLANAFTDGSDIVSLSSQMTFGDWREIKTFLDGLKSFARRLMPPFPGFAGLRMAMLTCENRYIRP